MRAVNGIFGFADVPNDDLEGGAMPSNSPTAANAAQYYGHARPEVQALIPTEAERILDIG